MISAVDIFLQATLVLLIIRDVAGSRLTQDIFANLNPNSFGAFVMNLDSDRDRIEGFFDAVSQQEPWMLDVLNRVPAVDGRDFISKELDRHRLVRDNYISAADLQQALDNIDGAGSWDQLSPGALGLYLSHAIVWKDIVDKKLSFGLVFEDDLRYFGAGFEPAVRQILESKPAQPIPDLAYFQHCEDSAAWAPGFPQGPPGTSVAREVMEDEIVPCTSAYLLSQRAAKQLLEKAFPISMQLDRALSTAVNNATRGLRRLIFEPALAQVGPESYKSTVQSSNWCSSLKNWGVSVFGLRVRKVVDLMCYFS